MGQIEIDFTDPDSWWEHYLECYEGRTWRDYRPLLAEAALDRDDASPLLDVGCGLGFLVECARQEGIEAVGLEASPKALELARTRHPIADIRAWESGTPLPLGTATIGSAMLNEFVDHITMNHNRELFMELERVVRPGGLLIVKSPSRFNRYDNDQGHISFFSPSEFRGFVESFEFEVIRQPFLPQPSFGRGRIAWLAARAIGLVLRPERWAARIDVVARRS